MRKRSMSGVRVSPNAKIFAAIVSRVGKSAVARQLGCDEATARRWALGTRVPAAEWRTRIASWDASLPEAGWKAAPADVADVRPVLGQPEVSAGPADVRPTSGRAKSSEERLEEIVAEADHFLEAAKQPDSHATARDIATMLGAKSSAVIRLSRLRCEDAIGERRIVESPAWRRFSDRVLEALRPFPEATDAILKAIKEGYEP